MKRWLSSGHITETCIGKSKEEKEENKGRRERQQGGGGTLAQSGKKNPFFLFLYIGEEENFTRRSNSRRTYSDNHDAVVQKSEADKGESVVQQDWRENNKQEYITLVAG